MSVARSGILLLVLFACLGLAWANARPVLAVDDLGSSDPSVAMPAIARMDGLAAAPDGAAVLRRGLAHPSPRVRALCCAYAARLYMADAADDLVAALSDPDSMVRLKAAEALRKLRGWSSSLPVMRVAADRTQRFGVRQSLLVALGCRREYAAIPLLRQVAEDATESVALRRAALTSLGELAGNRPDDLSFLDGIARGRNAEVVRETAIAAMGRVHTPQTAPLLIGYMTDEKETPRLRASAAGALGCSGDTRAMGPLQRNVSDAACPLLLRVQSVAAVYDLGGTAAHPFLAEALKNPDKRVRRAAALAARRSHDVDLVDALNAQADVEKDCTTKDAMHCAASRLTQEQRDDEQSLQADRQEEEQ